MLTDTETRMLLVRERHAQLARAAAGRPQAVESTRRRRAPKLRRQRLFTAPAKLSWRA